ncbi:hypothetical protein [Virgisporangium aurantiacum]|uniref:Phytanoyl-CoA dioxygenase n=1 Tax=Virgisporangium aurantiacum TaxID=175570 RepID=A0A8J3Z369_9ACTN|nr:hypothetical protein [Virgisporangium aurantiacum]GIJ54185.1 phytanoyl-CoA dioxygenase [Virgisporangium aurantiacum]
MKVLTHDDVEHFLEKGYVRLRGCFTPAAAQEYARHIWERLGYRPDDPSTWERPSVHMASHRDIDVKEFAPRAWWAACDLVGGEERMATDKPFPWTDGFIVNLWQDADRPWRDPSADSPGWHVDGAFFRHYLDSPEQGLLAFVLWSDVVHRGGATFVATDSVAPVARYLADHPDGCLSGGRPVDGVPVIPYDDLARQCSEFIEATGDIGDVYLLHPMILHAKSQNVLRRPRVITNSTLFLSEPMRFNRPNVDDHSPVERAVLRALGVDRYDFVATGPRERRNTEPAA